MSDRKKLIVVLMNCQGSEVTRYLRSSANIAAEYTVEHFLNYTAWDDYEKKESIYQAVREADVLISQNVQNIEWLRNDELARHIKPTCQFIRLAFWRFDGFWPISMPRFTTSFWYPPTELEGINSFQEYMSYPIDSQRIKSHFESQVEKLLSTDEESDIRMASFFLENYTKMPLFTDYWHPTAAFFLPVCVWIIEQLGYEPDINLQSNSMINRDRYRLVLDSVHSELGLTYDASLLRFYDHWITREIFFDFALSALPKLAETESTSIPAALFESWRRDRALDPRAANVAQLGKIKTCDLSAGSLDDAPKGQLADRHTPSRHLARELAPAPDWSIDLRDFREVSSIAISNGVSAGSLAISTSHDGLKWTHLTTLSSDGGVESSSAAPSMNVDLAVPVIARHVGLARHGQNCLDVGEVEVRMNIIGEL